jgi:hypothetical protein
MPAAAGLRRREPPQTARPQGGQGLPDVARRGLEDGDPRRHQGGEGVAAEAGTDDGAGAPLFDAPGGITAARIFITGSLSR